MSYYQKTKFNIATHAIVRAKQRIALCKNQDDLIVKCQIIDFINKVIYPEFSDYNYDYYRIHNQKEKYLYIVVMRKNNLITTITPISYEKKCKLLK